LVETGGIIARIYSKFVQFQLLNDMKYHRI
jgi:hypothetical protein